MCAHDTYIYHVYWPHKGKVKATVFNSERQILKLQFVKRLLVSFTIFGCRSYVDCRLSQQLHEMLLFPERCPRKGAAQESG